MRELFEKEALLRVIHGHFDEIENWAGDGESISFEIEKLLDEIHDDGNAEKRKWIVNKALNAIENGTRMDLIVAVLDLLSYIAGVFGGAFSVEVADEQDKT